MGLRARVRRTFLFHDSPDRSDQTSSARATPLGADNREARNAQPMRPLRAVALLLVAAAAAAAAAPPWAGSGLDSGSISKDDFPGDFSFGAGTSAYQVRTITLTFIRGVGETASTIVDMLLCGGPLGFSGKARRLRTAGLPASGTPSLTLTPTPVRESRRFPFCCAASTRSMSRIGSMVEIERSGACGLCRSAYKFCNTGDDSVNGDVAADGYHKYKVW